MIVFAAIVPHSPILIPSVGKEKREALAETIRAITDASRQLYAAKAETIVMLSPHAPLYPDAFSGNVAEQFRGVIREFGDHGTAVETRADFLLMDHLQRHMRTTPIPFTLTSQEELDYGFTVPLYLMTASMPSWKLVPLSVSMLDLATHHAYGKELGHVLQSESHRVAIIASVDLSHHANAKSAHGERPEGATFDRTVREAIASHDANALIRMDPAITEAAGQCGLKPLITFLGALEGINAGPKELTYEAPFGVGYLTARYSIA